MGLRRVCLVMPRALARSVLWSGCCSAVHSSSIRHRHNDVTRHRTPRASGAQTRLHGSARGLEARLETVGTNMRKFTITIHSPVHSIARYLAHCFRPLPCSAASRPRTRYVSLCGQSGAACLLPRMHSSPAECWRCSVLRRWVRFSSGRGGKRVHQIPRNFMCLRQLSP